MHCMCVCVFVCAHARAHTLCHVRLFVSPSTVAHQVLLSMGFSRQEYWSGLPFPCLGDLSDPGIEPASPVSSALQVNSLPTAAHTILIHKATGAQVYKQVSTISLRSSVIEQGLVLCQMLCENNLG